MTASSDVVKACLKSRIGQITVFAGVALIVAVGIMNTYGVAGNVVPILIALGIWATVIVLTMAVIGLIFRYQTDYFKDMKVVSIVMFAALGLFLLSLNLDFTLGSLMGWDAWAIHDFCHGWCDKAVPPGGQVIRMDIGYVFAVSGWVIIGCLCIIAGLTILRSCEGKLDW